MERLLRSSLPTGSFIGVSERRLRAMSAVRGRGNRRTEVRLKMALVRQSISGWSLHPKFLKGCPDFLFESKNLVIFVDGCFWHGCPKCGHTPKTNRSYWETKSFLNKKRDKKNTRALRASGYHVVRFWEHELRENLDRCAWKILAELAKGVGSG